VEEFRLFIDGRSVDAVTGRVFESMNPYTGEPSARVAAGNRRHGVRLGRPVPLSTSRT